MDRGRWLTLVMIVFCAGLLPALIISWPIALMAAPDHLADVAFVFWVISMVFLYYIPDYRACYAAAVIAAIFFSATQFAGVAPWPVFSWGLFGCVPLAWATRILATRIEQYQRMRLFGTKR